MNKFKQCVLIKVTEDGLHTTVSWLPAEYAKVDQKIRLKDEDGNWNRGWTVFSCGTALAENCLPDYRKDIRSHRRATGDSLPKREMV